MRNTIIAIAAVLSLFAAGVAAYEADNAVKKLKSGESLDAQEQQFWRSAYEAWVESEQVGMTPGNPVVGKALSKLADGRLPDEDDMAAIVGLYNRSKSREYSEGEAVSSGAPRPAAAYKPGKPSMVRQMTPYLGIAAGFVVAVGGLCLAARLTRFRR
ncbi:MAG TPA: hypothetical protein ENN09_03590 [Planctomycetes bacterium]|nr:hypothetical protein [Planctomycetota bacterium]